MFKCFEHGIFGHVKQTRFRLLSLCAFASDICFSFMYFMEVEINFISINTRRLPNTNKRMKFFREMK